MRRLRAWWKALWCSHEDTRKFKDRRVYLVCSKCDRETAGWHIPVSSRVTRPGLH